MSNYNIYNLFRYASSSKITEIFFVIDDFSIVFDSTIKEKSLSDGKPHHNKPCKMSESEVATTLVLFHLGGYCCLKHFYLHYVCKHMNNDFPKTLFYNRFVELQFKVSFMLVCFLKMYRLGEYTGVSFVDSTKFVFAIINEFLATRFLQVLLNVESLVWGRFMDSNYILPAMIKENCLTLSSYQIM